MNLLVIKTARGISTTCRPEGQTQNLYQYAMQINHLQGPRTITRYQWIIQGTRLTKNPRGAKIFQGLTKLPKQFNNILVAVKTTMQTIEMQSYPTITTDYLIYIIYSDDCVHQ